MDNQAYIEYISKKPFEEKLRAFARTIESMTRASYESAYGCPGGRDYYRQEYKGQQERAEMLFLELKKDYGKENPIINR